MRDALGDPRAFGRAERDEGRPDAGPAVVAVRAAIIASIVGIRT